jgi:hypothetical protein
VAVVSGGGLSSSLPFFSSFFYSIFLFLSLLPYFLSFVLLFFLSFFVYFSLLFFFLSFSLLPYFFLLFFLFSFFSSPVSFLPCIYRQNKGEKKTYYPCPVNGTRVGWSGRPLCSRPYTTRGTPLLPFLQHVESFGQVGVLGRHLFERKGDEKQRNNNLLLPLLCAFRERRRPTLLFKTTPFRAFFLL